MIQTGGFTPLVEGKQKERGQEERESELTPEHLHDPTGRLPQSWAEW